MRGLRRCSMRNARSISLSMARFDAMRRGRADHRKKGAPRRHEDREAEDRWRCLRSASTDLLSGLRDFVVNSAVLRDQTKRPSAWLPMGIGYPRCAAESGHSDISVTIRASTLEQVRPAGWSREPQQLGKRAAEDCARLRLRQAQRADVVRGGLSPHVERIIAAEHDVIRADTVQQISQRRGVMHQRVAIDVFQIGAGGFGKRSRRSARTRYPWSRRPSW